MGYDNLCSKKPVNGDRSFRQGWVPMARRKVGVRINEVTAQSPAAMAGLRKGDLVVAVNGEPVLDELDCTFLAADSYLQFRVVRDRGPLLIEFSRPEGTWLGITFDVSPVKKCRNNCLFCFVDQLPRGLRKSLYVKDEDFRHSFLYGNYVTLTGQDVFELGHIARMGYSPIYVSVHATSHPVRLKLLGVKRAPVIMEQLRFLAGKGVAFHTQLVICPGINDGVVLEESIADLLTLGESLLSVAVVPVGLTKFRSNIMPVEQMTALSICSLVMQSSDRDVANAGHRRVFCADELFIKAGLTIPSASYYGEYPQIENGVGLVRAFLDDWRKLKRSHGLRSSSVVAQTVKPRIAVMTSVSASAFVSRVVKNMAADGKCRSAVVAAVSNRLLGETVTVAGLIGGRDTLSAIRALAPRPRKVILPGVMFNARGHTLDGWSRERIEKACGVPVKVVSTVEGLYRALSRRGG